MAEEVAAELASEDDLVNAIVELRRRGYRRMDAHTPFPSHRVLEALELARSPIPRLTLAGALIGGTGGYLLMWWTQAVDYPLDIGGRPDHAVPAFVPITFESAVLLGALFTFVGFLWMSGLPRLWKPLFEVEGFERASRDRFWLVVSCDGDEEPEQLMRELRSLRATDVRRVEEAP